MALSEEFRKILVCPQCKGDVVVDNDDSGLVCFKCSLRYPVRDGIPIMLIHEAEKVGE